MSKYWYDNTFKRKEEKLKDLGFQLMFFKFLATKTHTLQLLWTTVPSGIPTPFRKIVLIQKCLVVQ